MKNLHIIKIMYIIKNIYNIQLRIIITIKTVTHLLLLFFLKASQFLLGAEY